MGGSVSSRVRGGDHHHVTPVLDIEGEAHARLQLHIACHRRGVGEKAKLAGSLPCTKTTPFGSIRSTIPMVVRPCVSLSIGAVPLNNCARSLSKQYH